MARPRGNPIIEIYEDHAKVVCKHCSFIIDLDDVELLMEYKWFSKKSNNYFYAYAHNSGKDLKVIMHRIIMGAKSGELVDHKNRDTLDNRKQNLRICTRSDNNRNAKKNIRGTSSQYKGVVRTISGKYISQIFFNKKRIHLGLFLLEKDAALRYDIEANKLFGEFANLNFKEKI